MALNRCANIGGLILINSVVNMRCNLGLIPDQNKNESLHKTDCCNVLSDC